MQHAAGVQTESLRPRQTFIPWIVVNGDSGGIIQKEALRNFKLLVCSKYTGEKPEECEDEIIVSQD